LKKQGIDYLPDNKVKLIQGGIAYFQLLEQIIDEARESIHLQTYIYDEDETGTVIGNALIRAATRGVKVYVLLDGYGSQNLSGDFIKKWTDAGIFFRKFESVFKSKRFYIGRRLHHKIVVVDAWRCTVAGLNISNRYNDTPEASAWLDWAIYLEGEVAPELQRICEGRFGTRHRHSADVHKSKNKEYTLPGENIPVRIRVNDRLMGKQQIYNSYLEIFRESVSSLIIMSAYFLPGREFRRNIVSAARRGVNIKVVLTGNADVFLVKYAERFIYRWLFKHKIEVYEYRKNVLHGKIALCDDRLMTVGSYNVNNLSAFASIELNLDVKHPQFVAAVHERLEEIIQNDCVRVTEKAFNRQFNLFSRLAHRSAYAIFRFLFFISIKQRGDHW
jgi:cardiolipin synthase